MNWPHSLPCKKGQGVFFALKKEILVVLNILPQVLLIDLNFLCNLENSFKFHTNVHIKPRSSYSWNVCSRLICSFCTIVSLIKLPIGSQTSQVFLQGKANFCLVAGFDFFIGFSRRRWIESEREGLGAIMGLKLKQARKAFMEVPNMNHCSADARRSSPVLLRENLPIIHTSRSSQRRGERGAKCFRWLYSFSCVRYDWMLLFL